MRFHGTPETTPSQVLDFIMDITNQVIVYPIDVMEDPSTLLSENHRLVAISVARLTVTLLMVAGVWCFFCLIRANVDARDGGCRRDEDGRKEGLELRKWSDALYQCRRPGDEITSMPQLTIEFRASPTAGPVTVESLAQPLTTEVAN